MTRYVALLRAVNVGGTGKLPMAELKKICGEAGFRRVETYIASGNVVFESKAKPATVKAELESRLRAHFSKPIGVVVRTAAEMAALLQANPFPHTEPKHTYAIFLDARPRATPCNMRPGRPMRRWPSASARSSSITPAAWADPGCAYPPPKPAPRAT